MWVPERNNRYARRNIQENSTADGKGKLNLGIYFHGVWYDDRVP